MPIHEFGTLIANRYEVVQGPREKPSLAGGMGLVYLCVDHAENGRPVALKTFRPELLPDRAARDRFLREGTTWVQLGKHPHIVRCHQVFKAEIGPEVFFALDLVAAEGKRDASLRSWLTPGKPLSVEQALLFALHIARGMKHATTKIPGLVHRDLKPENVLVGQDGFVRVTDFGLANAVQDAGDQLQVASSRENDETQFVRTQLTRGIVGTPQYMAPEQWAGAELDARTDIYAFGFILYEMITGRFALSSKNLTELEKAHRNGDIGEMPLYLPSRLSKLLKKCMAANREERYNNWIEAQMEVASTYKDVMGNDAPDSMDIPLDMRVDRVATGWSYIAIGASYKEIGKVKVAIEYFEQAVSIGLAEKERRLEASGFSTLGNSYLDLSNPSKAIEYHERDLAFAREISNRRAEGKALANLGNAYRQFGDINKAINLCEEALNVAREIHDLHLEGTAMGNLGIIHGQIGNPRKAIEYLKHALLVRQKIGDKRSEGQAFGNLGTAFLQLGDTRQAIEFQEKRVAISRETGDPHGEAYALVNLGTAYSHSGNLQRTIECYEKSLALMRNISDRQGEGSALGNLGTAYIQAGDLDRAIECLQQQLMIAGEISDRRGEGQALGNLGIVYSLLGIYDQAIDYYNKSLMVAREIGDNMCEAQANFNLARLLVQKGRATDALSHAEDALRAFTQFGHKANTANAQKLISEIRTQLL